MYRDKKNIDGTKMKREVIFCPMPRDKKYNCFENFAKDDKTSDGEAKTLTSLFTAFSVKQAEHDAGYDKKCYPSKMKRAEKRKTKTFFDTACGFPKVFHSHNVSP